MEDHKYNMGIRNYLLSFGWSGWIIIQMLGLNASICDQDENLLFYSNGCQVQIMRYCLAEAIK